jgi:hypothetical protein
MERDREREGEREGREGEGAREREKEREKERGREGGREGEHKRKKIEKKQREKGGSTLLALQRRRHLSLGVRAPRVSQSSQRLFVSQLFLPTDPLNPDAAISAQRRDEFRKTSIKEKK